MTYDSGNYNNVDYINNVFISSFLVGTSKGSLAANSDSAWFDDSLTLSRGAGVDLNVTNAKQMEYKKVYTQNAAQFVYSFESGQGNSNYFSRITDVEEDISLNGNSYMGNILTTPNMLLSKGSGTSNEEDEDSSFDHEVHTKHLIDNNTIRSTLTCQKDWSQIDVPDILVDYSWDTFVASDGTIAQSSFNITSDSGNRDVFFEIRGFDPTLGNEVWAGPLYLDALDELVPVGYSKTLYVMYEIR